MSIIHNQPANQFLYFCLQVNDISYILNVSTACIKPPHISDGHFLRIPVNDSYSAKLQPYFNEAFQFLGKKVPYFVVNFVMNLGFLKDTKWGTTNVTLSPLLDDFIHICINGRCMLYMYFS